MHEQTHIAAAAEQPAVDAAYRRLDELRETTRHRLAVTLRNRDAGTPQSRSERDALVARDSARLAGLRAVEENLVFGRLDRAGGHCYVGRLGLRDEHQNTLLVDWRAEAAEGFYRATAANPGDVVQRRHLRLQNRKVVAVHDDVLRPDDRAVPVVVDSADAALLEVLNQPRTGRMHDIVATIQAEQDCIIRAPLQGVLVVQGGPGTGKTAVALHRIAYLLHRYRDRLERRGVLLVGPNDRFLRYISDVLPSLGETSVVASTVTALCPGMEVTVRDTTPVAELKGSVRMVDVLHRAVRSYQRVPYAPIQLDVDGRRLLLRPEVVASAHEAARATREQHNLARGAYASVVLDDLAAQLAAAEGEDLDDRTRGRLMTRLHVAPDVRREVNLCWMPRTPEQVLERLWRDPSHLATCARDLCEEERRLLHRSEEGWSPQDVPLLDELAELLGPMPPNRHQRKTQADREREERERVSFAADSLASLGLADHLPAAALAQRFEDDGPSLTLAERAGADRSWAFGHVVVDEAQELSPMAWRMLFRRCPQKSMTVVGDVNQASAPGASADWAAVFDTHAPGRWRRTDLTVNYRTPGAVMDVACRLLRAAGREAPSIRSLRSGKSPASVRVRRLTPHVLEPMIRDVQEACSGTIAVLVAAPDAELAALESHGISVLTAQECKGLEFDHVLVVEPAAFLDRAGGGINDLYVALTRATQQVTLVHSRPLGLSALTR